MIRKEYVTDSVEALEAASVSGVEVWIHGSITYVTSPEVVEVKSTKKSKVVEPVALEAIV